MHPRDISIQDYTYELPEEKIALFPLEKRDTSKLLVYKEGQISEDRFVNIASRLPKGTLLLFNNTKVIHARLEFFKPSGARIEIFCLEPASVITEYSTVMASRGYSRWKCLVGGAAKWKEEPLVKEIIVGNEKALLNASKISCEGDTYIIELSWQPEHLSFAEILEAAGKVPLPPYIKRQVTDSDESRYQTIFARHEGSVAAPTAGLHFSADVFDSLSSKQIECAYLTLHVGAGTFRPVKANTMQGHEMHAEYIDVSAETIRKISKHKAVAAVGTTALRTIESLYWLGVKASLMPNEKDLTLGQWDVYADEYLNTQLTAEDALVHLLEWMERNSRSHIFTKTQLLIAPGYKFRLVKILTTNFHQPQSTLLLLVAAAVGSKWKVLYNYALNHDFRFLSYGDSNLIFIEAENTG